MAMLCIFKYAIKCILEMVQYHDRTPKEAKLHLLGNQRHYPACPPNTYTVSDSAPMLNHAPKDDSFFMSLCS